MTGQPYTKADLERGEQVVRELHGLEGFDAWAQHIAQALATERERNGADEPLTDAELATLKKSR